MPKVTLGAYSIVGAGSVAIRDVSPLATVFGVPAIKIVGHEAIIDENRQPNQPD